MGNHIIDIHRKRQFADDIHWNCDWCDSYNKVYNICISARGTAKTTKLCRKMYKQYVHWHTHWLILRRRPVDITEGYIRSIGITINKFLPVHKRIRLYFNKGDMSQGQVDVYLDKEKTKLFFRVQALSIPSERSKSNMIPDVSTIWFDENIPDRANAYLSDEIIKFRDVYGTYSREYNKYDGKRFTKVWLTGNPYTLYNPFFSFLGIDLSLIKPGAKLVGDKYTLDFPIVSEELKAFIRKTNPDLDDNDDYVQYALNGVVMNDTKYKVSKNRPFNYKLKYVFRIGGSYLLCWKDNDGINMLRDKWYIEQTKFFKTTRKIYSIDFDNLIQGTCMLSRDIRVVMTGLKEGIGRRAVTYNNVNAAVLIESLYKVL